MTTRLEELQNLRQEYQSDFDTAQRKIDDFDTRSPILSIEEQKYFQDKLLKRIREFSEDIKYIDRQIKAVQTHELNKGKL